MEIIKRSIINEFLESHPDAVLPVSLWYKLVICVYWKDFEHISQAFPEVKKSGKFVVFSVSNGKFLIVANIDYNRQRLFIRDIRLKSN